LQVVIAADEYYRKSVSEPPGSRASWNTRDQHMTTSLLRIQARKKNASSLLPCHFILKAIFCQDRLGTDIGKALKKRYDSFQAHLDDPKMVRKTHLLRHFILKMMAILPRQAWDKYRER
jgi:hypothetical protein